MQGNNNNDLLPVAQNDTLGHERFAITLLDRLERMSNGRAVALRGPWGRGKTDVLGRVQRLAAGRAARGESRFVDVLAINPWKHGLADLLTPLVRQLLDRLRAEESISDKAKKLAKALLAAGVALGSKASLTLVPAGGVLEKASEFADRVIEEYKANADTPSVDAVESLGSQFRELVAILLNHRAAQSPDAAIIVCVDDLDRCTPDRQIAMLEAVHFLVAADARAIVLCAIDPRILRIAMQSRYGVSAHDADAFLEKVFVFSQDMPRCRMQDFIVHSLDATIPGLADRTTLRDWATRALGNDGVLMIQEFAGQCMPPALMVPRVIERAIHRMQEAAIAGLETSQSACSLSDCDMRQRAAFWIVATTRWPLMKDDVALTREELRRDMQLRPEVYDVNLTSSTSEWQWPDPIKAFANRWPDCDHFLRNQRPQRTHGKYRDVGNYWTQVFEQFGQVSSWFEKVNL